MSIFVIGDKDTVLGFALIGIAGEAVASAEEARAALDRVVEQPEWQIVLLTRPWPDQMRARLDQLRLAGLKPVLVEIPGSEPEAAGRSVRDLVEETVGFRLR